jgi:hypothetical protein
MRVPRALLHAMRTRRIHRIGPIEAERLVAGDLPGPELAALRKLLDAADAPAAAPELTGEKATVAAFRAHRTRAARAARRPARMRVGVVSVAAGLALLVLGGTAVAARTGNLPPGAQQHAHRLFSALGVPAPRTGPTPSVPRPVPTPAPSATATATASASVSASAPPIIALSWCESWPSAPGRTPLDPDSRRKLVAAAGGEPGVEPYCAGLRKSASVTPSPSSVRSSSASPFSVPPSSLLPSASPPSAGPDR